MRPEAKDGEEAPRAGPALLMRLSSFSLRRGALSRPRRRSSSTVRCGFLGAGDSLHAEGVGSPTVEAELCGLWSLPGCRVVTDPAAVASLYGWRALREHPDAGTGGFQTANRGLANNCRQKPASPVEGRLPASICKHPVCRLETTF